MVEEKRKVEQALDLVRAQCEFATDRITEATDSLMGALIPAEGKLANLDARAIEAAAHSLVRGLDDLRLRRGIQGGLRRLL